MVRLIRIRLICSHILETVLAQTQMFAGQQQNVADIRLANATCRPLDVVIAAQESECSFQDEI
jgi:hypothetical protein